MSGDEHSVTRTGANDNALRIGGILCGAWLLTIAYETIRVAHDTGAMIPTLLAVLLLALAVALAIESLSGQLAPRFAAHVLTLIACGVLVYTNAFTSYLREPIGTDELYLTAAAAESVVHGENPYGQDLARGPHGYPILPPSLPASAATHLDDGTIVRTMPYPAGAALAFVPAIALKFDPLWINSAFFVLAVAIVFWLAPAPYKTLAPLVLLVDPNILGFGRGGAIDILFVVPLMAAAFLWIELPILAGAAFGIACAMKQVPWLDAPIFLAGIAIAGSLPAKQRLQRSARALAAAAVGFAVPNIVFLATRPRDWSLGVLQPFLARYHETGVGLVAINAVHPGLLSRLALMSMTAAVYIVAVAAGCIRFRSLKNALWLVPGIALFFAPRSFENYFVFLLPVCLASWFGSLPEAAQWKAVLKANLAGSGLGRLVAA